MKKPHRILQLVVLVLALLLSVSASLAQDAASNKLTYTIPTEGEITNQAFSQTWTLQTASADLLTIRVERTSGNLLPDVVLLDSNSQQITASYGTDNTGAVAEIENYTLPAGGDYQVLVQRREGGSGLTTGKYTLTVIPVATADDNPNNLVTVGEVTAGTPVTGEITAAHWYHRYSFTAAGADVIQITARRTSGTLFPEIDLLDANGTVIQNGYNDYYVGDVAQTSRIELPNGGTYTIAVSRTSRFNGRSVGNYELQVNLLGAGDGNPLLSGTSQDVTYDTDLSGDIDARWYQDWKLTTLAGDTLTITATRADGNLLPEVLLLGGSGQEISHGFNDNTGALAEISHYQLDGPGTYTVRVQRSGGKTGGSTGAYNLRVDLIGSGEGSPNLAESSGTLEVGKEVTEVINGQRWADTWTFTGQKGVVLDFTVERTSGTLIPMLDIRDSNGAVITTAYPDSTQDRAVINGYALPGDGQYQVVVYRDRGQDGYTSGNYKLVVKPTGQ